MADFGKDQFSIRNIDKREAIIISPLDSFSVEAAKPIRKQNKKPVRKNTKMLSQQSVIFNDTDISDNDDFSGTKITQDNDLFQPDLSLKINPSTPGK